jgi:hypothetical protein
VRAGFLWLAPLALLALGLGKAAHSQNPAAINPAATPQPPPVPAQADSAKPATADAAAPIERSPLDTFLLRDNKGNLVPVLGMSFEEFEQLLRLKKGLVPAAAPDFTLERLTLVGSADGPVADFLLTATIRVRRDGWTRVPLQLSSAALREPPRHEGPGEFFVDYDRGLGGYTCWLKGGDAAPHVVTLRISAAVTPRGSENRLALALPHATESSLRLTVNQPRLEASLAGGEGIVSTRDVDTRSSEIAVLGPGGELQIVWRRRLDAVQGSSASQLDVNGEISVRIQSERRITADARLRVRPSGGPLTAFRVRLPPGMELLPVGIGTGYTASVVADAVAAPSLAAPSQENRATSQLVEVRLDRPATAVTEVLLRASRDADAAAAGPLMPARFEVIDAIRQRGTIDFSMDGEWQLDWSDDPSTHRIDLTPEAAAARVVARFEYFRQPSGLEVSVRSRPARVSVEPTHLVFVASDHVRVETVLRYRFRGSRAAGLSFDLADWKFDQLTPNTLFDFPVSSGEGESLVTVPFRPGVAPPSELELKLEAHRTFPRDATQLSLTFPRPLADSVAPANILVFAADNLELSTQASELAGLSADSTAGKWNGSQQPRLAFRDFGGGEGAQFVANLRRLSRATAVSARATARRTGQKLQVEQTLEYRIAHEPLRTFTIVCPRELIVGGDLQLVVDGERVDWTAAVGADPAGDDVQPIQFTAPREKLGICRVVASYSIQLPGDSADTSFIDLPLVLPSDEGTNQFTEQHLEFDLGEGASIEPDFDEVGEAAQPAPASIAGRPEFTWSQAMLRSRWMMQAAQQAAGAPLNVSQMWIQTWLTPQLRQERVVMRLTPLAEQIRIRLPSLFREEGLQTAIDGRPAPHNMLRELRQLVVPIPPAARGRECAVEIFYSLDPPRSRLGTLQTELQTAKIEDALPPRRVYWQVVTPGDRHLVLPPTELTSEMAWSTDGLSVSQRPVLDQRQLESWMKASRQALLPRASNEYLFGALGRWPTMTVGLAHRRAIAAVASALFLAGGLLLIHVPRARHPSLILLVAVVLGAAAVVSPATALLAAQGALLGILVTMVAVAIAWFSPGPSAAVPQSLAAQPRTRESSLGATPRPERSSRISATAAPTGQMVEAR